MNILERLKRKVGPLPLWAWASITGGSIWALTRFRGGNATETDSASTDALAYVPDTGDLPDSRAGAGVVAGSDAERADTLDAIQGLQDTLGQMFDNQDSFSGSDSGSVGGSGTGVDVVDPNAPFDADAPGVGHGFVILSDNSRVDVDGWAPGTYPQKTGDIIIIMPNGDWRLDRSHATAKPPKPPRPPKPKPRKGFKWVWNGVQWILKALPKPQQRPTGRSAPKAGQGNAGARPRHTNRPAPKPARPRTPPKPAKPHKPPKPPKPVARNPGQHRGGRPH